MEALELYKVKRGNQGQSAGVIIKGDTVSINIYGSQSKPGALTDMVDITGEGTIEQKGAVAFALLPEYIAFSGTCDAFEIVGVSIEKIGTIS